MSGSEHIISSITWWQIQMMQHKWYQLAYFLLDFQNKSLPSVWTQLNNFKILKFSYVTFCRLSRCKQKISKLDKAEFLQITQVFLWGNVWNIWVKLGVKYKPHVWHRWMQYISFLMSKLLPHSKVCLSQGSYIGW